MAYKSVHMVALGGGVELAQRRQDGALFMRDTTGHGKYGNNAGKWIPVNTAHRDEIGELICNGVSFGSHLRFIDDAAFRISADITAYVFGVPEFELIKNSPKIICVEDRYNDNDGAFQVIYWRNMDGIICNKNNKFENSDFKSWTISDVMPEIKLIKI